MFIKKVKSLCEFKILMKHLEEEIPDLRWREGQRPTGWEPWPGDFPKNIYLNKNNTVLTCYDWDGSIGML